jgi:hypothetical protein
MRRFHAMAAPRQSRNRRSADVLVRQAPAMELVLVTTARRLHCRIIAAKLKQRTK